MYTQMKNHNITNGILVLAMVASLQSCKTESTIIWQIGENNNSSAEFAMAPNEYKRFLEKDFGWEDRYFLIGSSDVKTDWPYVLPGPSDQWGGTWGTSGWRSHTLNILFGIDKVTKGGNCALIVGISDCNAQDLPVFKGTINGKSWKYQISEGSGKTLPESQSNDSSQYLIEIPLPEGLLKKGGNEIKLTTLQG